MIIIFKTAENFKELRKQGLFFLTTEIDLMKQNEKLLASHLTIKFQH